MIDGVTDGTGGGLKSGGDDVDVAALPGTNLQAHVELSLVAEMQREVLLPEFPERTGRYGDSIGSRGEAQ